MPCSGYSDKNPTVQLEADDYMYYVDYSRFNQNFEIQISGMLSYINLLHKWLDIALANEVVAERWEV